MSLRTKLVLLIAFVLFAAIATLSWRGLTFFKQDKETYVYDLIAQVAVVQAQELDKKLLAYQRLLAIYADFSTLQLTNKQRSAFLDQYEDFFYVATTRLSGSRLQERFAVAKQSQLANYGYDRIQVRSHAPLIQHLKKQTKPFSILNISKKPGRPLVAMSVRTGINQFVVGVLSQRSILDMGQTQAYRSYVVNANNNLVFHADSRELVSPSKYSDHPLVESWRKNPAIPMTREFSLGAETAFLGAYAGLKLAPMAIFIDIPKEQAFLAARRLMQSSGAWALGVFGIACFLGILFAYSITRSLKELAALTHKVAKGDFSVKANITTSDEIGELASSFNRMGHELDEREKQLEEAHQQLVQSEKMSAFGQMSAGIAHEVKNPLAGILGYAQLSKRKVEDESPVRKYIDIIEKETKRCKEIIENLMKFARQEKTVFEPLTVNQVVSDSIDLVDHQISIAGVKIERQLAEDSTLPQILGSANQIQQVLMNLMLNAQHAMGSSGTLIVSTEASQGRAVIKIADTGHGIEREHLKKIFEPFFTTKPAGKGTGLGLAVSYGIIKEHKGNMEVESEVGVGTTFIITFKPASEMAATLKAAEAQQVETADSSKTQSASGGSS